MVQERAFTRRAITLTSADETHQTDERKKEGDESRAAAIHRFVIARVWNKTTFFTVL